MRRNPIALLSAISILCFGCSKSKQPGPANNTPSAVKIELVSGNNQTDTIGRPLANYVTFKVTLDGTPLSNYHVRCQGSGCNSDRLDDFYTGTDGIAKCNWYLSAEVGSQTLKIIAVDANQNKADSITASATGLAAGAGWHFSACSYPFLYNNPSFCKLSTGRLFTCYNEAKNYIRYSDDNGASWNSVKGLGTSHQIEFVISSPSDEVFAFAQGEGVFYSNDAGTTWTSVSTELFSNQGISYVYCTPSSKLFLTTKNTLYISTDKGKTWVISAAGLPPNFGIGDIAEDKGGNLYLSSLEDQSIYKSADNGLTWTDTNAVRQIENDFSIYIDNNNWFYKSRSDPSGGIFISKDNGVTYTMLINSPNTFIEKMSVQSDGNFYYDLDGKGLFMANGISSSVKHLDDNEFSIPTTYIVAKNNNIIYSIWDSGLIKYYQK